MKQGLFIIQFMKNGFFWVGVLLIVLPSLVQAYLLMPFPGSQDLEVITLTYYLERIIVPLRVLGGLVLLYGLWRGIASASRRFRWVAGATLLLLGALMYVTDVAYKAERMFEEPQSIRFATAASNRVPDSLLVVGLVQGGLAKAYPVNYLGYHHKVQDSLGQQPVLVTYCTMCRTGRVYSPILNGKLQTFRLVGARHYNAVIEDSESKSWWYQATGEAVVGSRKGQWLPELDYQQMTLKAWLEQYPHSLILQPDPAYADEYDELKRYDRRQRKDEDSLTRPDKFWRKSWVVGIKANGQAKAFDWKALQREKLVNEWVGKQPVLVGIEADGYSYHAFDRTVDGKTLSFKPEPTQGGFSDTATASVWNWQGQCIAGAMQGKALRRIQAHHEYWLSWAHFQAGTRLWQGTKAAPANR